MKRDHGPARCRDHGEAGFGRWVGWGIVTRSLAQIAKAQTARATLPAPPTRRAA